MEFISSDLSAGRAALATLLGWPGNIGIQLSDLRLEPDGTPAVVLWVDGVAEAALVQETLSRLSGLAVPLTRTSAGALLAAGRHDWQNRLTGVAGAVLEGAVAVLAKGWAEALLLNVPLSPGGEVRGPVPPPATEALSIDLPASVALIRRRVRDPRLRASPVSLAQPVRGKVALVYLQGRAYPPLVRLMGLWARRRVGEEAVRRAAHQPSGAALGLLPRFSVVRRPGDAAVLLDTGHVLLLADGAALAFAAPVTAATWLTDGGWQQPYPLARWIGWVRLIIYLVVLLLPGGLVALLNYHVGMIPTPFLAAVSSARENAPFGVVFEVLVLELLVDTVRFSSGRRQTASWFGANMVTVALVVLLGVQSGFVGPMPALVAVVGALASMALPDFGGGYLVRLWRYGFVAASLTFGFFGMAILFTCLLAYLCRHRSWGVPFLGPSGIHFTSSEGVAAQPLQPKGGQGHGRGRASVR